MRALGLVLVCLLLAGCGGMEFKRGEKSHARREVPPGPGLFTGTQGEFVLFRMEGEPDGDGEAVDADEAAEQPSD